MSFWKCGLHYVHDEWNSANGARYRGVWSLRGTSRIAPLFGARLRGMLVVLNFDGSGRAWFPARTLSDLSLYQAVQLWKFRLMVRWPPM